MTTTPIHGLRCAETLAAVNATFLTIVAALVRELGITYEEAARAAL
jgi:hypothetical protein